MKNRFLKTQFEAQRDYYFQKFPDASYQIINFDKNPVGRLYVLRLAGEIIILDLTVLPEFRGKGIGTHLISELREEAAAAGNSWGRSTANPYIDTQNGQMSPFALAPTGSSFPHNNMQPYLTLNFCIALQGIFPPRT